MKLLLDTHVFLWVLSGDERLSANADSAIRDPGNIVYLSVASVWEATVKHALGKLSLPSSPETYLPHQRRRLGVASLDIDEGTVVFLPRLPTLHRDPFDRILICQAWQHRLTLVTVDSAIMAYPVTTLF